MNWLQIGAIAEVGKEFTEYHRLLKDHLHSRGVYMIARNKMMNSRDPLDLSKVSFFTSHIHVLHSFKVTLLFSALLSLYF